MWYECAFEPRSIMITVPLYSFVLLERLQFGSAMRSWSAQEIRLAERYTLLPQNVVGSGNVEVEVGDTPVGDVLSSAELELLAGHLDKDLSLLLALESLSLIHI